MVGAHNHLRIDHSASFGHTMVRCYHKFDINFQGYNLNMDTVQTYKPNDKNPVQAMMASPSTISDETWFFDTSAIHHLPQSVDTLSNVRPYMGNDKVIVGNVFPFQSTPDQSSSMLLIPSPTLLSCLSSPMSSLHSHTTLSTSNPTLTNMPSSTTSLPDLIRVLFVDISTSKPQFINQHPMVTRAKNGISQKKAYL
ncbi:hypothetical protein CK203_070835 [Vitis vinifera]|uniref:Retrovirus-related Pol polyprotein from transposon RE2 n=1 Tax=Vitis vinifera TaxID=29760 RepID=A0A438E3Q5_VITVI|nr:hypothetical protein CK203_070835 [Vitis vinifera]